MNAQRARNQEQRTKKMVAIILQHVGYKWIIFERIRSLPLFVLILGS